MGKKKTHACVYLIHFFTLTWSSYLVFPSYFSPMLQLCYFTPMLHLHKKMVYKYSSTNPTLRLTFSPVTSTRMWWFVNWRNLELETVTDEDEIRKITATEALKKLDEGKNLIEAKGSDHLYMIFNELMKMWSKWRPKNKYNLTLEVLLDFKIYLIYTVYSYRVEKKSLILISVVFFCAKVANLYIVDTWL